jgi:hypothetical protein
VTCELRTACLDYRRPAWFEDNPFSPREALVEIWKRALKGEYR